MFPEEIILASGNLKKLNEMRQILSGFDVSLGAQSEYGVADAVEDGLTFVENALIKARHASRITGKPAIADDSGLEVDYLKGAPGIYSSRFAAPDASDEQNLQQLLQQMKGVPTAQRSARYQCVIVYLRHFEDPTPLICLGSWRGRITEDKVGDGGFGYDPIFFSVEKNQTAAQMTPEEKAAISHRGKALAQFQREFSALYRQG